MRGRNGGGCDGPRPFRVIAIWTGFVLAQCRGVTVTALNTAVALVVGISAEGSEQPAHDEWGGSSSLFRKAFSASREWCGITAAVRVAAQSCVCPTAVSCQAGVPMSGDCSDWGHTPI